MSEQTPATVEALRAENAALLAQLQELRDARAAAVRSLEDAAAETAAVFAALLDAVLVYDAEMKVVRVNPGFRAVYGFDPVGLHVTELIARTQCRRADGSPLTLESQPTPRALHGEPVLNQQLRITRLDGQERFLETSAMPLRIGGRITGSVTVWHDITERKLAETALHKSEEHYRLLADNVDDFVSLEDAAGRHLYISPSYFRVTGWTPAELETIPWRERMHPDDLPELERVKAAVARGEHMVCEHRIRCRDGQWIWVVQHFKPLLDAEGRVQQIVLWAHNITERKAVAEALQESEARARALIQHAPTGIYEISFDGSRFISVNDVVCEWSGYSREELMAMNPLAITDDAGRAGFRERMIRKLSGENVVEPLELKMVGKHGRERIVLLTTGVFSLKDGRPESVQVIAHDITERKATESALRDSEARFRDMFELHNAVKLVIEPESGKIMDANPAAARFYGYTRERLCQMRIQDINPLPPELVAAERQQAAAEQRNYFVFPHRLASGEVRWVEVYTSPVETRGRALLYAIIHDITARKQAEQAIAQSKAELEVRVLERTASLTAALELTRQEAAKRRAAQAALEEQMRLVEAFLAHSLTPLVFLDRKFNFVRVNAAYARACGKNIADFPGHNHFEFYPHAENQKIFAEVVRTGQPFEAVAKPFTFPDHPEWGTTFWDWTLVPLCDAAGVVQHLVFSLENVTERKRAEDRLQLFQRDLRELTTTLLLTEERERKQLAMVLHDSIGQLLALMRIKLGMLEKRLHNADATEAGAIKQLAEDTLQQVRGLTTELSPPLLYKLGLAAALQDAGEQLQKNFGVAFHFEDRGCPEKLDETLRILLYQSGRELLANIGKHAQARNVRLTLAAEGDRLRLVIADDGVGFDPEAVRTKAHAAKSFGFFSVAERMHHVGGTMEVQAAPGRGATITLSVPLQLSARPER